MVNEQAAWFYRSPEQEAAFKAIGIPHPYRAFDENYDQFLLKTKRCPPELCQVIIRGMTRVQTQSGEEYLVYSITERRFDGLGNEHSFFRSNMGMFHVPIPEYRMRRDAQGYEEKYVHGVRGRRVQYSIPFNKKNVEKLRKHSFKTEKEVVEAAEKRKNAAEANKMIPSYDPDPNEVTRYSLHKAGQRGTMAIDSYEDWLTGSFEDLWRFGHANPTKEERDDLDTIDRRTSGIARRMSEEGRFDNVNPNEIRNKVKEELEKEKKDKEAGKEPYK